ncbi:hypothetical protein GCM10010398_37290 [Streptomyces fimbriatus]
MSPSEPVCAAMTVDGRSLSCLDFGGPGRPLLALHGHFNEGRTFTNLARTLCPDWRVVAPDQRGHGFSDRGPDFSRTHRARDRSRGVRRNGARVPRHTGARTRPADSE